MKVTLLSVSIQWARFNSLLPLVPKLTRSDQGPHQPQVPSHLDKFLHHRSSYLPHQSNSLMKVTIFVGRPHLAGYQFGLLGSLHVCPEPECEDAPLVGHDEANTNLLTLCCHSTKMEWHLRRDSQLCLQGMIPADDGQASCKDMAYNICAHRLWLRDSKQKENRCCS